MSLTFDQGRDIMLAVFKAAWDGTGFPAVYTDVPGDAPASNVVWARVIIRHATGNQASLAGSSGCRRFTETGTIFISVFGPVGDGSKAAYDAAKIVSNAFRDANEEVWFRRVRINEIGTRGAFEQINVLADFSYDEVR